eukprot:1584252-Amphidinium_carterae.1
MALRQRHEATGWNTSQSRKRFGARSHCSHRHSASKANAAKRVTTSEKPAFYTAPERSQRVTGKNQNKGLAAFSLETTAAMGQEICRREEATTNPRRLQCPL